MQMIRLILLCAVTTLLVGCAVFSGSQEPAPVYSSGVIIQNKPPAPPKAKKAKKSKAKIVEPKVEEPKIIAPQVPDTVEVKPLGDNATSGPKIEELAPEPLTAEQQAVVTEQNALTTQQTQIQAPETPVAPVMIDNVNGPVVVEQQQEVPAAPVIPPFQPLETFASLSPAISALASSANQKSQSGNVEAASTIIERAIRIEPRNATLYYKLALLKLKSSKPREAEDLAKKAALLASNDIAIKKHSWLLIAKSREVQGNIDGANEARTKANGL
jgi:hypothetical protein